jgi:hypothetical protein
MIGPSPGDNSGWLEGKGGGLDKETWRTVSEAGLRVNMQHGGQGKGNGFSGARLGYSYDVAAAQSHGPCLALNGRWL